MKNAVKILMVLSLTLGLSSLMVNQQKGTQKNETGTVKGKVIDAANREPLAFVSVTLTSESGKTYGQSSDFDGLFEFKNIPSGKYTATAKYVGYQSSTVKNFVVNSGKVSVLDFKMQASQEVLESVEVKSEAEDNSRRISSKNKRVYQKNSSPASYSHAVTGGVSYDMMHVEHNTEAYSPIDENGFKSVMNDPLSTFSVDVDAASYSNMRRFLRDGQMPPEDAIRVEEMINYFNYDYPNPDNNQPFSITTELGDCPWNSNNRLVHIGLQGERIEKKNLPNSNLVFLIDVSGSMFSHNKLPLLKKSMTLLVNELSEKDRVAIVVYAGAAGEVLPSTSASEKETIINALENLQAGGSTAGGAGIKLAYKIAEKNFIKNGNNRIILATDGDFNIGASSDGEMQRLIEEKRKSGVFLTCLGFGMGNYKDSKMEILANKGNGNYAYIDDLMEAKKVLVNEMGATLLTIAKDVKIQVEFNPEVVSSYRLVGYENRLLNAEDFNDDTKDAGEIGAGHSVTALYEVELKENEKNKIDIDPLKYQNRTTNGADDEILTVKFRYKAPDGDKSKLIEKGLKNEFKSFKDLSENFVWSASVASFGMLLRNSEFKKDATYEKVINWAQASKGKDENGYRAEFIQLVKMARDLDKTQLTEK